MHIENNNYQLKVCLTLDEVIELADPQLLNKLSADGYFDLLNNPYTDGQTDRPYESMAGLYDDNPRIADNQILDNIFNAVLKTLADE